MKIAFPIAVALLAIGCNADDEPQDRKTDVAGDAGTPSPTPDAAAGQCVPGTVPNNTPAFGLTIRSSADSTGKLPTRQTVDGWVSVERSVPGELDLVADSGQRIALRVWSGHVPVESLVVGARLWLSASTTESRPNPYAYVSSAQFTLRTSETGAVLLAELAGTTTSGTDFLGVPVSVEPLCTVESASSGSLSSNGRPCSITTEHFQVAVEADPPVRLKPGTMTSTTIGGTLYDLVLSSAEQTTYADSACMPADWASSLSLGFRVVARDWAILIANLPVLTAAQLPACRLAGDVAPVDIDAENLDWDALTEGSVESPMTVASIEGNVVTFALPSLGTVTATARSAEAAAILARGRWLSVFDYYQYRIRERADGPAIVAVFRGQPFSKLVDFASDPYVLGLRLARRPRCEWLAAGCSESGKVLAASLHEVRYGNDAVDWVPSSQQVIVTSGSRSLNAWIAIDPGCADDPQASAAFVVTQ
jgi:hypothetical protein